MALHHPGRPLKQLMASRAGGSPSCGSSRDLSPSLGTHLQFPGTARHFIPAGTQPQTCCQHKDSFCLACHAQPWLSCTLLGAQLTPIQH